MSLAIGNDIASAPRMPRSVCDVCSQQTQTLTEMPWLSEKFPTFQGGSWRLGCVRLAQMPDGSRARGASGLQGSFVRVARHDLRGLQPRGNHCNKEGDMRPACEETSCA